MRSCGDVAPSADPAALLRSLGAPYSIRSYPPRRTIFAQGDPCDAAFYLQAGQVKLSRSSSDGKVAVIAILGAGSFFGKRCLTGIADRTMTATTITATTVMRVEKAVMAQALRDQRAFADAFIAYLLKRNIHVEDDLADQLFNSSEKRLARALLQLSQCGEPGQEAVIAKISQATLAEMIGTTRSRVNFFMNKFRRLGFIETGGGIRVNSSLLNVILHD